MKPIKDFENYSIDEWGIVWNKKTGKEISPFIDRAHGVFKVTLFKDGGGHKKLIHRLVAIAFLGEQGSIVLHKDGNKTNNHYSNLFWSKRIAPCQI